MTAPLAAPARAKVNLALGVVGRRPDGYHELASVFLRLALADSLEVAPVRGAGATADPAADRLSVEGDAGLLVDNLVLHAAAALRRHAGRPLPALAFRLLKRIPTAAGLGGGSSDAAAALALAAAAWRLRLAPAERSALAAGLGSDVPFFAAGAPLALVEGRGEAVRRLPALVDELGVLLVTPPFKLATAAVFAAFAVGGEGGAAAGAAVRLAADLERSPRAAAILERAVDLREANDLWPAALSLRPELGPLRAQLEETLGRPCLLSGSGPTLVALYPSGVAATSAAASLAAARWDRLRAARIVATVAA